MRFTPQQKILFIGDSITDCGRRDPLYAPLGRGYVKFFHDLQLFRQPDVPVQILNRGIGGNCIDNLRSRWHDDVLTHRPDVLSVKIGINDLNQALCQEARAFLNPAGFEGIYDELLSLTRQELPETKLLLISPFYLSHDTTTDSYRAKVAAILPEYVSVVERLAQKHGARFLNLQACFQEQLRHHHPDVFCPEPVHPNGAGHLFMAEQVWRVLVAD